MPIVVNNIDESALSKAIRKRLIGPYFKGINRFLKKGDSFEIGDFECCIGMCDPPSGIVAPSTKIRHDLLETRSKLTNFFKIQTTSRRNILIKMGLSNLEKKWIQV